MKKLSILIVAGWFYPDSYGGSDRYIYEFARRLVSRGHRVDVITSDQSKGLKAHECIEGIEVWRYPVDRRNSILFYFSTVKHSMRLTRKLLKETDYDIINFHHFLPALGACIASFGRRMSRVYSFHAPVAVEYEIRQQHRIKKLGRLKAYFSQLVACISKLIMTTIEGLLLKRCNGIITLSSYTQKLIGQIHNIPENLVGVIPGGVDSNRFAPAQNRNGIRRELNITYDKTMLFCVRRLYPRMGLENLIRSMAILSKENKKIELVIGGKGPLEFELKNLIEELDLENLVRIEGLIEEDRLPKYYQAADLFVLPTIQLEGFGMVTLESLASGTPVIGTPVGGTREILDGLDDNFLLAGTSPEAIAEGVREFLKHDGNDGDLRTRCRSYAMENYDWEKIVAEIESKFCSVCRIKENVLACVESAVFGIINPTVR